MDFEDLGITPNMADENLSFPRLSEYGKQTAAEFRGVYLEGGGCSVQAKLNLAVILNDKGVARPPFFFSLLFAMEYEVSYLMYLDTPYLPKVPKKVVCLVLRPLRALRGARETWVE